jgi:TolB-like protein
MFSVVRPALLVMALVGAGAVVASDIHRELDDISKRLATKIEESRRTKVAVADFTDLDGNQRQIGRFISEELSTNLVLSARGYSVIDRNHLRTILREQKLSMSGLMDPENQKKIGKILGVDALILGSINPFGEQYRITFKVVATDTAEVVAADRGMVPKTPATDQLWETIIRDESAVGTASAPTQQTSSASRSAGVPGIVSQPKKGESGSQPGKQGPFANVTTSFDGINVQVQRLVRDPAGDGSIRLIFLLSNSSDEDRRMLFLGPVTTLIDELGNVYSAVDTVGVESCKGGRGEWNPDVQWCNTNFGKVATRLAPGVPVTVSIKFKPTDGYSKELAQMSQTVSLRSRLAHYTDDRKDGKTADIIVNSIPFPR